MNEILFSVVHSSRESRAAHSHTIRAAADTSHVCFILADHTLKTAAGNQSGIPLRAQCLSAPVSSLDTLDLRHKTKP